MIDKNETVQHLRTLATNTARARQTGLILGKFKAGVKLTSEDLLSICPMFVLPGDLPNWEG